MATTTIDEITEAGPGTWFVVFNDNTPVVVVVPEGSNLRQTIERQWPGVSAAVAISASPTAGR